MSQKTKISIAYSPNQKKYKNNDNKIKNSLDSISIILKNSGYEVSQLALDDYFLLKIKTIYPHLIFNYTTVNTNTNEQILTRSLLEKSGLPFLGSSMKTTFISSYKDLSKYKLSSHGLPIVNFQFFDKLNIQNQQAILVEEFIKGRNLAVAVWGNYHPEALTVHELKFNNVDNNNNMNHNKSLKQIYPALIPTDLELFIKNLAIEAYKALEIRDYGIINFIISEDDMIYITDTSVLPELDKESSLFVAMANTMGLNYDDVIKNIINIAFNRYHIEKVSKQA
ncbi:D-alanine--D-alanine ligase family protein [Natronospora cellulosivora (SeqCode)]